MCPNLMTTFDVTRVDLWTGEAHDAPCTRPHNSHSLAGVWPERLIIEMSVGVGGKQNPTRVRRGVTPLAPPGGGSGRVRAGCVVRGVCVQVRLHTHTHTHKQTDTHTHTHTHTHIRKVL